MFPVPQNNAYDDSDNRIKIVARDTLVRAFLAKDEAAR